MIPRSFITLACLASVSLLACGEVAGPESENLDLVATNEDCEDVEWCDPDGDTGGSTPYDYSQYLGFFGSNTDYSLHAAPGDPNPGAPGVWLGANVTTSACTASGSGDVDNDTFRDTCELPLARAFAPTFQFVPGDWCPNGEPAWALRVSSPSRHVRIAYMPAYYADCGSSGGHTGDSEIVTLTVIYNSSTQHWELLGMWTSAHSGAQWGGDQSRYSNWTSLTYPTRSRAFPMVWVSIRKHANYPTPGICNSVINGDHCETHPVTQIRFPVQASRNVAPTGRPNCFTSPKFPGRTECFFNFQPFNGWQSTGPGVTSYTQGLFVSGYYQ